MSFGAPLFFWVFLLLPVAVALFVWNEARSRRLIGRIVAERLREVLAGSVSHAKRRLRFLVFLAGLAGVILAMTQPRYGYTIDDIKRRGRDIIFAVDVSKSMLSTDVQPNRLTRAKLAAQDLLNLLPGDRVGVMAFAGTAFLEAPLTIDYNAAVSALNELDPNVIPVGGTDIAEAIRLAAESFGKGESAERCLILFTDGEELSEDAVAAARQAGGTFRIFTVGLGSADGSLIPATDDHGGTSFLKDDSGNYVKSRLDESRLSQIAQATGGFYTHLQSGPQDMKRLFDLGITAMKEHEFDEKLSRHPIERYQWPLGAGLFFLSLSLFITDRKRVAAKPRESSRHPTERSPGSATMVKTALLGFALLLPVHGFAINHGLELYEQKDYQGSFDDFTKQTDRNPDSYPLRFDKGTAAYKLGKYDEAIDAFSKSLPTDNPLLRSKAEYNLGNALFQRAVPEERPKPNRIADLKNALQHYDQAIKLNPKDEAAPYNRGIASAKLKELTEPPKPTPTPPPQNQKQNQDQKDQQKQQQQDQQKQDQKDQRNKDQKQDQQQQQQDQKNQQDQQQDQQQQQQQQQAKNSSGGGKDQEQKEQASSSPSPSPGPGASPSPSPGSDQNQKPDQSQDQQNQQGQSKPDQNQNGQPEASPTPQPGPEGSPSPTPSGEIQAAGSPSPGQTGGEPQNAEAAAQAEPGAMTENQANALLESLRGEDQFLPPPNEHKPSGPVLKDW